MIEVKLIAKTDVIKTSSRRYTRGDYRLFIDGTLVEGAIVSAGGQATDEGVWFTINFKDYGTFEQLAAYTFAEFPERVFELVLHFQCDLVNCSYIGIGKFDSTELASINFSYKLPLADWKEIYSPMEYYLEFKHFGAGYVPPIEITLNDPKGDLAEGFYVEFPAFSIHSPIITEFTKSTSILREIRENLERSLISQQRANSVLMYFDFPEEVKVPCEQYLLYFVQFLKDVGVEATAELQHKAGHVLFAVTPTNKEEALDKIRVALKEYIFLAASPVDATSVLHSEIEVQRLAANIQHLQGQLTLAHAVLEAKNATIQLQQATINQHNRQLSGEIIFESIKDVSPNTKDKEEVLGGLAEITKYEGKGVNVNLPEVYRRLKQLFSRGE